MSGSIEAKRREAELARERVLAAAQELQARLKPAAIAEQAVERLRRQSERAGDGVLEVARQRPVAVAAATAGVATLLLTGPLVRLVRRARNKG